jgi:hypothetical protein
VPTEYHPRPTRCSKCGDVVLVAEHSMGKLFGSRMGKKPTVRLEHADPGPHGELWDAVDDGCRRPRVDGPGN